MTLSCGHIAWLEPGGQPHGPWVCQGHSAIWWMPVGAPAFA